MTTPKPYTATKPSERELEHGWVILPSPLGLGEVFVTPEQVLQMIALEDIYRLDQEQCRAAHSRAAAIMRAKKRARRAALAEV